MFLVVLLIVFFLLVLFSNNSKTVEKYDSCDEPSSQATDNATTQDDKDDSTQDTYPPGMVGINSDVQPQNTKEPFDNSSTADNDVKLNSIELLPSGDNGPKNMDEIITAEAISSNPTCTSNKTLNRLGYGLRAGHLPGPGQGHLIINQSSEVSSCNNIHLLKPLC